MSFYQKILDYKKLGKTYVIAEVGSNYRDYNDQINAVSMAKAAGADAVKFQYFDASELYGPISQINPLCYLPQLKAKADAVGIDLICSAFSPEGMKQIDQYIVAHKIASSEMSHIRLLEMAKKSDKPLILSTGGYFLPDIARVLKFLGDKEVVVLHCNISYPTKYADMKKFNDMKAMFPNVILGYSDHTINIDVVPMAFASAGAVIIEKHFNPFNLTDTPDAPHSLSLAEFKQMVSCLRGSPSAYSEENEARLRHIRRIVATKDIAPGDILKENDNIGIFRSRVDDAAGGNPFLIEKLEGRQAKREVKTGYGLSASDVI